MQILYNNKTILEGSESSVEANVIHCLENQLGLLPQDFYYVYNGRRVNEPFVNFTSPDYRIHVVPRTVGGKGGFGSMLRAIGAQIEKTTNREACRDLSGRRLRDINEEKRLKTWIAQQAEREKEAIERKKKKLEKLCEEPKFEFKDPNYDELRLSLPEKVEDAVTQGLQASCSSKRKSNEPDKRPKKKTKRWFDEELDSSDEDENDSEEDAVDDKNKKSKSSDTEDIDIKEQTNKKADSVVAEVQSQ